MRRYGRWLILSTLLVGATLASVTRPATAAGLVDEIKQRGTMRFCVADWPYLTKDPKTGKWTGYDADLAEALAGRLGVKVEFVDSSWGNIIPALLAKKCDVAWGGFFHTAERAQVVDYTKDVHNTGLVVVVKQGETRFKSYDDLNKPGVVFSELADIGEIEARKNFPNATVKILQTDNTNQQALEVAAGRADANVTDVLLAYELIEKKAGIQILAGPIINKSDLGMLVRKDTPELKEAIKPLAAAQFRPVRRPLVHGELLAQGEILEGELAMAAAEERDEANQVNQRGDHGTGLSSDLSREINGLCAGRVLARDRPAPAA